MGRHRRRTPELRDQFVRVGVQLLEADGLDQLTTRRVAQEAGSSLAALNELFGAKQGLVNAIALHGFELLAAELALDLDGGSTEPRQELVEVCRAHGHFVATHPRLGELMFSRPLAAFDPEPDHLATAASIRRAFTDPFARLLGRDRSDATVIDVSIGLVALVEGLARHDRGGMLGSSDESASRRFLGAVATYLDGAVGS